MKKLKSVLSTIFLFKFQSLLLANEIKSPQVLIKNSGENKIILNEKDLMNLVKMMTKNALEKSIESGNDPYSIPDTINLISREDIYKNINIMHVSEKELGLGTQDGWISK
jgi:hypothetical protein